MTGCAPDEEESSTQPGFQRAQLFDLISQPRLSTGPRWPSLSGLATDRQFPAAYEPSPDCTVRVHCDDEPAARLLVPVIAH